MVKLVLSGPAMQAIQVTQFNFTKRLHALLSDSALVVGNLDNFDVNPTNPFATYAPPSGRLSTIMVQSTTWRTKIAARKPMIFWLE
jgi:hypothetical protein